MSQSIQPKFSNFSQNFYVDRKPSKHTPGTFRWSPLPSLLIIEGVLTIQNYSIWITALESTIYCSHSTWWGEMGQLHCITPRKFHRPPMKTGIIFPCSVHLAHPSCVILSYLQLCMLSYSGCRPPWWVCIYFSENRNFSHRSVYVL